MSVWKVLHTPLVCAIEKFCLRSLAVGALVAGLLVLETGAAEAARPPTQQHGAIIVVASDYGGSVRRRFKDVFEINRLGQRVEIRARECVSSCTMLLGANNVCVSPTTTFGFHGPSRFGSRLTPSEFDAWSKVISANYPAPVKTWYMQEARYAGMNVLRVKGSELIRLGLPRCP